MTVIGSDATALQRLIMGFRASSLIHVIAELGVADLLADGPMGADDLAARCDAHPDALRRILRGLAQYGVVAHLADGRFALTPLGAPLRTDAPGSLRLTARLWGRPLFQRAWGDLLHTARTGEPAFDHVFGQPYFDYLAAHPDAASLFHSWVASRTTTIGSAVLDTYDFGDPGTVIDVGAGTGGLTLAVLAAYPAARGVLGDLPHNREASERAITAAGLSARCRFEAIDFFAAVPADGDTYLLKSILHDWDDEHCIAILGTIRRAMGPTARLLVIENILPDDAAEALERVMLDVHMLATLSGRERSATEFAALLAQAGLRLARVVPNRTHWGVIEALPI